MSDALKKIQEQAARDALAAAVGIVAAGQDEADPHVQMKKVLLAIQAVNRVVAEAEKQLDPATDLSLYLDEFHIVASALWFVAAGAGLEVSETEPYCDGAAPFLGFARACVALEAAQQLSGAIDNQAELWGGNLVDEVLKDLPEPDESRE